MPLHQGEQEKLLPLFVKRSPRAESLDVLRESLIGGTVELLIVPVTLHQRQDLPVIEGALPIQELRQVHL